MRLPLLTKAGMSQILNLRRRVEEQSISFLPSTKPNPCLGDVDASHFLDQK
jgi:hypothetical protein